MLGSLIMLLAGAGLIAAVLIGGRFGVVLYAGSFALLLVGYAVARLRGVR